MNVIIICIVCFILIILESLYCELRKIKETKKESTAIDDKSRKEEIVPSHSRILQKRFITDCLDGMTFLLFKIVGYIPVHFVRTFFYRFVFHMKLGNHVVIYYGLETRCPWNIEIGEGTIVGDRCILDARYGITLGRNVNLSSGVWIWTLQHDVNSPTFSSNGEGGKVTIGDRAWISSRTSILPGVEIAKGCVVACGAVVVKKCENEFGIYGGIPAKKIGERCTELVYEFDGKHRWFL